jgi:protease I
MPDLSGKRIAILATDGVEEVELTQPRRALEDAGATVELLSPAEGQIQAMDHMDRSSMLTVDRVVGQADPTGYDGLVLPGGVVNGDHLRVDEDAQRFVRELVQQGTPVGVICHGGWILVETGLVKDRTMTSYPTLRTDIINAGGTWVDEEVHVDHGLVSSRRPRDLPAFCRAIVEEFAEGSHERAAGGSVAA